MTIRRDQVTSIGPSATEWINLSPGKLLNFRTIQLKSVRITAIQLDRRTIACRDRRIVCKTMVGVHPTIGAAPESILHSMCIAGRT